MYCPSQIVSHFMYPWGWEDPIPGYRISSYLYRIFGQYQSNIPKDEMDELHNTSIGQITGRFALAMDIPGHIGGPSWPHVEPYGLNVAFADTHAEFVEVGLQEYQRAVYYNNTVGEGAGGPYKPGRIRDPYVFALWKAIDAEDFSDLRAGWPLP